jgi:hypothetical protein
MIRGVDAALWKGRREVEDGVDGEETWDEEDRESESETFNEDGFWGE